MAKNARQDVREPGSPGPSDGDRFYIPASASLVDERVSVLKHGDTFAVFDRFGDVQPVGLREQGLYHDGTRFLSRLEFRIEGFRPILLSSAVKKDNAVLLVDMTNADLYSGDQLALPKDTVHVSRATVLWNGVCHQKFAVKNYSMQPVELAFSLRFDADFADIFEVRGIQRPFRGKRLQAQCASSSVTLVYEGLDRVLRRAVIGFSPEPEQVTDQYALYQMLLAPREEKEIRLDIACRYGDAPEPAARAAGYEDGHAKTMSALRASRFHACDIWTSNGQMNGWLNSSFVDLHMMMTDTPTGLYPYAGVPWFSAPFGRDGILTALEYLWINPNVARGALSALASMQAKEMSPFQDAEPGKILHEARKGEMAALKEIPFGLYYGSIDSTPLYVLLAGAYFERTGDIDFVRRLWPSIELALRWIDEYGDADGDGFVEYMRHSSKGLVQQGWKDSQDSVFHADGTLAEPPIALCEVQGYVYAAKSAAASIAARLGRAETARRLEEESRVLQERFERAFWCPEIGTYGLALDGKKKLCKVRSSNARHCLFSGIVSNERARLVAEQLFAPHLFTGWGIRTLSSHEARYNPMSYHNGSVWPHDNALIAAGLARYGLKDLSNRLLSSFLDASGYLDLQRMPELFCGFERRPGEGPTSYPVACSPQAWAAAAVFLMLQSVLGLIIKGPESRVYFSYPVLPEFLQQVRIRNLRIGEASVDLLLQRSGDDVSINVLKKEGRIEVLTAK